MPKNQNMLPTQFGGGRGGAHDFRRGGTVDAPEHNLGRGGDSDEADAKLSVPDAAHKPPSGREMRRKRERLAKRNRPDEGDAANPAGDDEGNS